MPVFRFGNIRHSDNELKVNALKSLEATLQIPGDAQESSLQSIIEPLKLAFKSGNSRVSSAGLSCSAALFGALRTRISDSQPLHTLQNALNELLAAPGIVAYLGDTKETTRDLAGKALLAAGNAAAAQDRSGHDGEPFLATLDRLVKEQGFVSKNARTREQVSSDCYTLVACADLCYNRACYT